MDQRAFIGGQRVLGPALSQAAQYTIDSRFGGTLWPAQQPLVALAAQFIFPHDSWVLGGNLSLVFFSNDKIQNPWTGIAEACIDSPGTSADTGAAFGTLELQQANHVRAFAAVQTGGATQGGVVGGGSQLTAGTFKDNIRFDFTGFGGLFVARGQALKVFVGMTQPNGVGSSQAGASVIAAFQWATAL